MAAPLALSVPKKLEMCVKMIHARSSRKSGQPAQNRAEPANIRSEPANIRSEPANIRSEPANIQK